VGTTTGALSSVIGVVGFACANLVRVFDEMRRGRAGQPTVWRPRRDKDDAAR
jgi:hypothetical protein